MHCLSPLSRSQRLSDSPSASYRSGADARRSPSPAGRSAYRSGVLEFGSPSEVALEGPVSHPGAALAPPVAHPRTREGYSLTGCLECLMRCIWPMGGKPDRKDGVPRLFGRDVEGIFKHLEPGDIILNGNGGALSHSIMYVGQGSIIHAMAQGRTRQGIAQGLRDSCVRTTCCCLSNRDWDKHVGVVQETFGGFLDRFDRDTYAVVRYPELSEAQIQQGVERLLGKVGKSYDYGFQGGNDAYYCTELVAEFLDAALGSEAPTFNTRVERTALLLNRNVIDIEQLLEEERFQPIIATPGAFTLYPERLQGALVAPSGSGDETYQER